MEEIYKRIEITCSRCGYKWLARYDPKKTYYQCPKCKYPNKILDFNKEGPIAFQPLSKKVKGGKI